jgi:hypothetical protein
MSSVLSPHALSQIDKETVRTSADERSRGPARAAYSMAALRETSSAGVCVPVVTLLGGCERTVATRRAAARGLSDTHEATRREAGGLTAIARAGIGVVALLGFLDDSVATRHVVATVGAERRVVERGGVERSSIDRRGVEICIEGTDVVPRDVDRGRRIERARRIDRVVPETTTSPQQERGAERPDTTTARDHVRAHRRWRALRSRRAS